MKAFSKEEVTVRRWWLISPHWVHPPFIPCQLPTNPTTTTPAQCTKITLITSSQIQSDGLKWNTKHQMDLCLFPQVFFSQPFHDPCPFREITQSIKWSTTNRWKPCHQRPELALNGGEGHSVRHTQENIARVRNCPAITILNSLFGLFVFLSFVQPPLINCLEGLKSQKSLFVLQILKWRSATHHPPKVGNRYQSCQCS